ncbi:Arc family DNA-binding protein [Variovorax paradoxus]|uniref:Arc family DNA-binding protein n=1 Tax=Variovorax paradoxus TaxID=34073 RepID=UPI00399B3883
MDEDRFIRITLRLPKDLHQKLEGAAAGTAKSMNAEIVARVQASFEAGEHHGSDMARTIQRLQGELDDRDADMQKLRELLRVAKNMFGLLQGRLRESGARLSPDEAQELGEVLQRIHEELEKPEPIEEMLDRIDELADELEQIQGALRSLGVEVDQQRLGDPTEARARLEVMRSQWEAVKKKSDE